MAEYDLETLTRRPILELNGIELADALNHCFQGYIVPFQLTAAQADARFRRENVDGLCSSVWFKGDETVGVTMISRRGSTCRLAAMAIAPDYRGKGIGSVILKKLVTEARERGDKRFLLEVFEANRPAVQLYERGGFQILRRLVGYERAASEGPVGPEPEQVDVSQVCSLMHQAGLTDLPWHLHPDTLTNFSSSSTLAFSLEGKCFAIVTPTPTGKTVLWSLFTLEPSRGKGYARQMLDALQKRWPENAIHVSIVFPEDLVPGFWSATGFEKLELAQLEMGINF